MENHEVIDRAVVAELLDSLGGDEEFLAELLDTFYADTPQQLAAIEQALANGDAEVVRRAAHSIKSNSATFGAPQLYSLCKTLEDKGKDGNLDDAAKLTAAISAAYQQVEAALRSLTGD